MQRQDLTILVIDDEQAVVDLTTTVLTEEGFAVLGTTDPDEALRLVEEMDSIKVLISDVMMPKMAGPEIVRMAQRIRQGRLRVLFVTGGFDGVRFRQTDRILQKPWSCAELLTEIRTLLADIPRCEPWSGPERRRSAA
jgi:DNA-binding response OmpR family regulator